MREQMVRNCQTITGVDRLLGNIQKQLQTLGVARAGLAHGEDTDYTKLV